MDKRKNVFVHMLPNVIPINMHLDPSRLSFCHTEIHATNNNGNVGKSSNIAIFAIACIGIFSPCFP